MHELTVAHNSTLPGTLEYAAHQSLLPDLKSPLGHLSIIKQLVPLQARSDGPTWKTKQTLSARAFGWQRTQSKGRRFYELESRAMASPVVTPNSYCALLTPSGLHKILRATPDT